MAKVKEAKLWKWFSLFIRLRDSDSKGFCKCFTCSNIRFYKNMDAGHGIGRQHMATKYSEKNNHAQCSPCNAFEGGKREVYKVNVNKKYGAGTWEYLEIFSRKPHKLHQFEVDQMAKYYEQEARRLAAQKGLEIDKKKQIL